MATPEIVQKTNYQLSRTLHGHKKAISSVRFSPNGEWLASSCIMPLVLAFTFLASDSTVRIWDAYSGAFKTTLIGHTMVNIFSREFLTFRVFLMWPGLQIPPFYAQHLMI